MNKADPANWQSFETWLDELRLRRQIPGVAVRFFDASEVLFGQGYGYRNLERAEPVTEDTIFGIASVSKSFTALAILRAATAGRLRLDDSITDWLPEFTLWEGRRPPTIRHFLTHTSGLPALPTLVHAMEKSGRGDPTEVFNPPMPASELRSANTSLDIIEFLNQDARIQEPGGLFCYQNDAWGLLGEIITRATETRFEDYVFEELLLPLDMHRTTFDLERVMTDRNATTLYAQDPAGNVIASPKWHDSQPLAGAGFLRSTAADLTRYVRFLMQGAGAPTGIDPGLLEEMRSPLVWCGPAASYGYGLTVFDTDQGVTMIGHSGGLKGVSSHIGFVPELGVGGVVLSNLEDQPAELIWLAGINTVLGLPPSTPRYDPGAVAVSPQDGAAILGDYRSGEPWGRLLIELREDGGLQTREGEQGDVSEARLVSRDEIAILGVDQNRYVPVLRDPAGHVYGVHYGRRILYRV